MGVFLFNVTFLVVSDNIGGKIAIKLFVDRKWNLFEICFLKNHDVTK